MVILCVKEVIYQYYSMMIKKIFFFFLLVVSISLHSTKSLAQEYKYEIGPLLGTSFYMGDANRTKLFMHPNISGGFMWRYNLNLHWAVKTNLVAGVVSGNSTDAGNIFPHDNQVSFKRTFVDLGGQIEYNFFPYSNKFSYMDARPYTPYLFAGLGATYASGDHKFFNANIPLGVGFKYKLKNKLNIGVEFSMRKLFGDDFDVTKKGSDWSLDAPFGIKSGFLKNRDWYSLTMLFVTWEFGLRGDACCGP